MELILLEDLGSAQNLNQKTHQCCHRIGNALHAAVIDVMTSTLCVRKSETRRRRCPRPLPTCPRFVSAEHVIIWMTVMSNCLHLSCLPVSAAQSSRSLPRGLQQQKQRRLLYSKVGQQRIQGQFTSNRRLAFTTFPFTLSSSETKSQNEHRILSSPPVIRIQKAQVRRVASFVLPMVGTIWTGEPTVPPVLIDRSEVQPDLSPPLISSNRIEISSKCPLSALVRSVSAWVSPRDAAGEILQLLPTSFPWTAPLLRWRLTAHDSRLCSWWYLHMEEWYAFVLQAKCPFFKRRACDGLDLIDSMARTVLSPQDASLLDASHASPVTENIATNPTGTGSSGISVSKGDRDTLIWGPPPAWRGPSRDGRLADKSHEKLVFLSSAELCEYIRHDWRSIPVLESNHRQHRGYYVTGKLNQSLYRDDCLFTGPDPDLPVRGLRKYLSAASQLFDPRDSRAILLSLDVFPGTEGEMPEQHDKAGTLNNDGGGALSNTEKIVARWRLFGTLRLPWHPRIPDLTGTTTYHRDPETGLIMTHEETWDLTVVEAFVRTLGPTWLVRLLGSTFVASSSIG
jgi:hypothetical protein